ncbi:MAG: PIG-L deacetylase family protein [Thermodesulfobacteriota bacterium]
MKDRALLQEFFIAVETGRNLEDYRQIKENILVIAPHPDDDVLGAGGYMAKAAAKRKQVFALYMTDGAGSPRLDKDISDIEMGRKREKEAISALRLLRAKGGFFLRFKSKELLEKSAQIQEILQKILSLLKPEVVFIPAPYERHKTHLVCTQISLEALRAGEIKSANLFGYSIWGNFWGGHKRFILDITAYIKDKVQAILAHESQIGYKNYQQGILGKNNYEAIFWESHEIQKITFAEIFLDMSVFLQNPFLSLADFIRQDMEDFINIYFPP